MGGRAYPVRHYPVAIRLRTVAFGNKVALTVDRVNIEATCASALPKNQQILGGPIMYCAILCIALFLRVGTLRAQYSECVPSHSFT